ncbi:MAG: ATP-binding cassette domain-containing protein [Gammaproteobacteria bacterium]|nr:ATP-binding cassette domain-containing protein [Gammaproteobacteria bacterium]
MIQLSGVSLQRGTRALLSAASLRINPGERVGVIGANGCGKSTLFALLRGELHADAGDVSLPSQWRIAAMEQEVAATDRPALEFVLDGDAEFRALEAQIETASGEALGELHARFAAMDGYRAASRAHELLDGLGFAPPERERPVREFSGGWRLRLALARTLMCPSELMLLDEPTNHLDLDALVWLEAWLLRYAGTLLLISHDRDFLDTVANRIVAFEGGTLGSYKGNYSSYELQRAEKLAGQQNAFQKQQQRIQEIESFVARFRAKATKARQAQSRLKELERMTRIAPAHVDSPFSLRLPCSDRVSTPLLNFEQATLGYAGIPILHGIELGIMPAERIGLLGPNGAGKSTLIKSIAGELAPLSGKRHCGEHLQIGYFAQHQLEALDLDATPLLHVQRLSPQASEQSIRDFLGSYGFHGEQALASVGNFSGGEQARLALALVAWHKPNLLLLDEPTNHLDLEMRHALTLALQEYPGAVLLVSHDRHLLRNTVDQFLLVADATVQPFDGDLDDYRKLVFEQHQRSRGDGPVERGKPRTDRREERRAAAERREQLRPLRNRISRIEKDMDSSQRELKTLTTRLEEPSLYAGGREATVQELLREQATLQKKLAAAEEAWLFACEELEQLESGASDG